MQYNTLNMDKLHIMHWNAQGITNDSSIAQLDNFLNINKIDIVMLNETFLKPHHKFQLGNYKVHRQDRSTHGGGVLIAVRKGIKHKLISSQTAKIIEYISISVNINGRDIILSSAYNPHFTNHFENDLKLITSIGPDFFIFGDFNAHHTFWNCSSRNSAGNILFKHCLNSNYHIHHPSSHTRFSQNLLAVQPSTVDLLLSNISIPISSLETHPDVLNSDHVPVTCFVYGDVVFKPHSVPLYNLTNWNSIRDWVVDQIESLNRRISVISIETIEYCVDTVISTIQQAFYKVPRGKSTTWQRKISKLTKKLIAERKRYNRKFQRCQNFRRKRLLKSIINQLNSLINTHLSIDRNTNWNKFISNLPTGCKKFWKIRNAIIGNRTGLKDLSVDGEILKTNEEKANAIANVFEKSHSVTTNYISTLENKVEKYVKQLDNCAITSSEVCLTDASEIKNFVFSLKNHKSPGLDSINAIVFKNMPDVLFEMLAKIFNFCLLNGYFPKSFKKSKVVPILKKGKNAKYPNSYRPISILSLVDKVFEKVIQNRLLEFTTNNNIINKEQFGFRKEHSTTHQIKRIVNIIDRNKQNRHSTGIVLLDIEKAFDSIWHHGLIYKLHTFRYPIYIQKIIKHFLCCRSFVVNVENQFSSERSIPAGLPQGSVLSPTLYSIFTADIKILKNHEAAFYADDSAFISSGKLSNAIIKKMENALKSTEKYFNIWKIKVNQDKTQAILFPFNKSPKRIPNLELKFQGSRIDILDEIKYLGVTLDKKLSFKSHINSICEKSMKCSRALFPLLNKRSQLNFKNKLLLYTMCIRPILTYGSQVWYHKAAKTYRKKLQIIQNKNLKIIHKLPPLFGTEQLHNEFGHIKLDCYIRNLTKKFKNKCRTSIFASIRNLI